MRIPNDYNWTQANKGDLLGILHETQNITLDNGKIRLSKKAFNRWNSSADDANLGYILGITYFANQYFALTDDNGFQFDFGGTTVTERTLTADVGLNSDLQVVYDRLYITTNDDVDYYNTSMSLTTSVESLTASVPHPMTVFDSLTTYKLAIGNGNAVKLLNSSNDPLDLDGDPGTSNSLTLPAQYQVTTLAYRNGYLYVGTKHLNGGEAKIFIWDGNTNNANFEVPTGASQVYSLIPYKNSVAAMLNNGQLIQINGNTPTQLGALPVFYHPDAVWDDGTNVSFIGKVMHRGMVAVGDTIYINVNGTVDSGFIPEMKHGLWVFDPAVGLYHRASHSLDRSVVETPSNLASNTLTLSTHGLKTGDLLIFRAVGSLTGIDTSVRYYVKVESSTTVKLAISKKALKAGNYVTIGGSIGGASVSYVPNTDWAGGFSQFQGAICAINPEEPFFRGWESPVVWGARISDFTGTAFYCLMSLTEAWNIGRFTTQKIYSPNITQAWKDIHVFLDGLHLDNEEIVVKVKSKNELGYPTQVYRGDWASATTITSVSATQDEDEWSDLEVGDELTIVDGRGRGYTTHITNISGTYTITVDESIGVASDPVYFYADKFKKIKTFTNIREFDEFVKASLENLKSSWVMIKCELRGYEPEVSHLELSNSVDKGIG